MLATALSATLVGSQAHPVRVEVEAARGVPFFELVGLAEAAVRESRVRVKSALAQLGVDIGEYRIVVNLAPADVKKTGSGFDLAIAAATLGALGAVPREALDGRALPRRALARRDACIRCAACSRSSLGARARGVKRAIVPRANAAEAALVDGIDVRTVAHARRARRGAPRGRTSFRARRRDGRDASRRRCTSTISPTCAGRRRRARALEIAAAGGHNLLMMGPPGAGKTMLARRLPGLLPPLVDATRRSR